MAIDPAIPLSVRPLQVQSPFALLGDLEQLKAIRAQAEQRRQLGQLEATRIQTETQKADREAAKARLESAQAQLKLSADRIGLGLQMRGAIRDEQSYQALRPALEGLLGPELSKILPPNYDAAALDSLQSVGKTAKEQVDARQKVLDDFLSGNHRRALADGLSLQHDESGYQQMRQGFLAHGGNPEILKQFPEHYSPEAAQRAAQLALTPSERTTQANQAPKVGTFEDYVLKFAQEAGKTPQQLSPTDIEAARKRYQQADDRQPKITVNTGNASDVSETVAGMMDGSLPPIMPGRATKEYTALMAESHRKGFDLAAAATDWAATQKHVATLNNAQQTRLGQNIDNAAHSLDVIEDLAAQWKGGKFPLLNKARLTLAVGGALGPKAQQIATQLQTQIADVTTELGNVYMGGNSPTDHALGLAAKNLAAEWAEGQLESNVTLARRNLKIRQNSMRNSGVAGASANNPYAAPPASDTAEEWVRDASGKLVKKAK